MGGLVSVGDIMLLSQLAWKIGCAFTSGRSSAPTEFQEVENELTSLTKAITLLTEVLDRDDSILTRADERTKDGLDKILECCRQTLENLDALVDQYQEVRRPDGSGSIAVQRVWKSIFIRNYKKIWWTSEGGNIQALRNMLQMHVSSITLTMQALQSKSLTRLENTIEPMADRVAEIHDKFHGNLDVKIAEIHELMQSMSNVNDSPTLWPTHRDRSVSPGDFWLHGLRRRDLDSNLVSSYNPHHADVHRDGYPVTPGRTPELQGVEVAPRPVNEIPNKDLGGRPGVGPVERPTRIWTADENSTVHDNGRRNPTITEHDRHSVEPVRASRSNNSYSPAETRTETPRPTPAQASPVTSVGRSTSNTSYTSPVPSLTMSAWTTSHATPPPSLGVTPSDTPQIPPRSVHRLASPGNLRTSVGSVSSSMTESSQQPSQPYHTHVPSELSMRISQTSSNYVSSRPSVDSSSMFPSMLPSPILSVQEAQSLHSNSVISSYMPVQDPTDNLPTKASATAAATDTEHSLFERELARDSATLCEATATLVEYTAPDEDHPGEWKMTEAASAAKISVITKMQRYDRGSHFVTSIWTMSDNRNIRLQQKLPEGDQILPYTIWGNNLKVVLRGDAELTYHDVSPNSKPLDVIKTKWVNYIFADETGSALFQSVLMGQSLILTLKTKRTLRVHDGLTGAFAFQEQLCGLENIRLWQDDSGDVLAMIHYSPHFRDGYLAFHVGYSSRKRIHFRGDGERHVKIKGLAVAIDSKKEVTRRSNLPAGEKSPKLKGEKKITSVRIEFTTEMDKRTFLNKLKEVQG